MDQLRNSINLPRPTSKGDGTQFLYLSPEYFDRSGLKGLSISGRLLFKYLTIKTYTKGFKDHIARSQFTEGGFSKGTLDRHLAELQKLGFLERIHRSGSKGLGNEWEVEPTLVQKKTPFLIETIPYRFGLFRDLNASETFLFEFLSYLAVQKGTLKTQVTEQCCKETGLPWITLRRARKKLSEIGLLGWISMMGPRTPNSKPRSGNEYFLNPLLVWSLSRACMEGYDSAENIFKFKASDFISYYAQIGDNAPHYAQIGETMCSFWGIEKQSVVPDDAVHSAHFGEDSYEFYYSSLGHNAQRQFLESVSEGGENVPPSEPPPSQRSPLGQDQIGSPSAPSEQGSPSGELEAPLPLQGFGKSLSRVLKQYQDGKISLTEYQRQVDALKKIHGMENRSTIEKPVFRKKGARDRVDYSGLKFPKTQSKENQKDAPDQDFLEKQGEINGGDENEVTSPRNDNDWGRSASEIGAQMHSTKDPGSRFDDDAIWNGHNL
jgi:hypothetical protein